MFDKIYESIFIQEEVSSAVAKNKVLNAEEPSKYSTPNIQSSVSTSSLKIVQLDALLTNTKPLFLPKSNLEKEARASVKPNGITKNS